MKITISVEHEGQHFSESFLDKYAAIGALDRAVALCVGGQRTPGAESFGPPVSSAVRPPGPERVNIVLQQPRDARGDTPRSESVEFAVEAGDDVTETRRRLFRFAAAAALGVPATDPRASRFRTGTAPRHGMVIMLDNGSTATFTLPHMLRAAEGGA